MKVYASRSVILTTAVITAISLGLFACFVALFDKVGSGHQMLDISLVTILAILFLSQAIVLYNFIFQPTLTVDSSTVVLQKYPWGQQRVQRKDLKQVSQTWFGLAQFIELEFSYNGKTKKALVPVPQALQTDLLKELNHK